MSATSRPAPPQPSRPRQSRVLRVVTALHRWAESGWVRSALVAWAAVNGAIFPGPSDALFIPLGLANPHRAFEFAGLTIVGAMLGGSVAYIIGAFFFQSVGLPLLSLVGIGEAQLADIQRLFAERGWLVVFIGGLPMGSAKTVAIAAGAFGVPFTHFFFALLTVRTARFLITAVLLYYAGSSALAWLERKVGKPLLKRGSGF